MHWLSASGEDLIARVNAAGADSTVDVLVAGSGYGGSVAALRLAEAGQRVYVLERGEEYVAGEFPNDLSQAGKHLRAEVGGSGGVSAVGYESALFDLRLGLRAGALVGNGLGGGSLINASVGLRPDARVFQGKEWPAALRQADLDPWFAQATRMLEIKVAADAGAPAGGPAGARAEYDLRRTSKYLRMQELAAASVGGDGDPGGNVAVTFEQAPLAVQIDGTPSQALGPRRNCIGCGDCVTGCNFNAKLSLTKTYLPAAYQAGAEFFTGLTVLQVQNDAGVPDFPWKVTFVRSGERQGAHMAASAQQGSAARASRKDRSADEPWTFTVRARRVVLAAGTFGSTEILARSRELGLPISAAVGQGVSGNGDDVAFAYKFQQRADAVGWGSRRPPPPGAVRSPVGPTISAMVRFNHPGRLAASSLIQDGGIPGLMGGLVHELLTTLGTVAQLDQWKFKAPAGVDPLSLHHDVLQRSMPLLGIGHDPARGAIVYQPDSGRVGWSWPEPKERQASSPRRTQAVETPDLHKARMSRVDALGALYIQNPAVSVLPKSIADVLKGPQLGGMMFTVHPLGGCRMGDSPAAAVVDDLGAVYRPDGGVHEGLFVMDGSIVPGSLGANPMLTITALAERACHAIVATLPRKVNQLTQGAIRKPPGSRQLPVPVPAVPPLVVEDGLAASGTLNEVLRGTLKRLGAVGLDGIDAGDVKAALFVQMNIPSWAEFQRDASHRTRVLPSDNPSYVSSRLVLQQESKQALVLRPVEESSVQLFVQRREGFFKRVDRFLRLGLTYIFGRWLPDRRKSKRAGRPMSGTASIRERIVGGLKALAHATEVREFKYSLTLREEGAVTDAKDYRLEGVKTLNAAASWGDLWNWCKDRLRGDWPAPKRRTLFEQLTELEVAVWREGERVLQGRLTLDLQDVLRNMTSQAGPHRDTLNSLLSFSGYALLLLRGVIKTRLLDFRAPDYRPNLPKEDPALSRKPAGYFELALPENQLPAISTATRGTICPESAVQLNVRRSHRLPVDRKVRIGLVHYKQQQVTWKQEPGAARNMAKAIVLINGFAQSTRAFVAEELGSGCLAAKLFDAGWDVWLLEYRVSPLLDASAIYSTMDDIAAFDIPAAVEYVAKQVSAEAGKDPDLTQVFAFSHCVGSASLAMSILGGWLPAPKTPQDANDKEPSRLAGVLFSQFLPFVIGSQSAQQRLEFASFLSNVMRLEVLQFTAGTTQADLLHSLLDRVFATFPYAGESCPHERDLRLAQPENTSCKRMTGFLSRLFNHQQLLPATHAKLDCYFGRTNLGVFLHGAKCVEYERLVNAEGQNAYVTDANIRNRMHMPVMLMQGEENVLFDKESLTRSLNQLNRVFGADPKAPGTMRRIEPLPVWGHAHFDCTIGAETPELVFPTVVNFFEACLSNPVAQAPTAQRSRARLPRIGPVAGWVRRDPEGGATVRVWIELETSSSDTPIAAVTATSFQLAGTAFEDVQAWHCKRRNIVAGDAADLSPNTGNGRTMDVVFAVADVHVPAGAEAVKITMFGVHTYVTPPDPDRDHGRAMPDVDYPAAWGTPMGVDEVDTRDDPWFLPVAQQSIRQGAAGSADFAPDSTPAIARATSTNPFRTEPYNFRIQPISHLSPRSAALIREKFAGSGADTDVEPLAAGPLNHVRPYSGKLTPAGLAAYVFTMKKSLAARHARAHQPEPGTLSRQSRQVRTFGECELELGKAQLFGSNTNALEFLSAGCRHPGITSFEAERSDQSLLDLARAQSTPAASFMLMLGDQIYADARAGVFDTASDIEKLLPRYRTAFGSPGFRTVARKLPLYMVVDDHEIGDTWSTDQRRAGPVPLALARNARRLFDTFQRAHGPDYSGRKTPSRAGWNNFSFATGGASFFVLDTRFSRQVRRHPRLMFAQAWQLLETWLLAESQKGNHPKFIVSGSVLAPGQKDGLGAQPRRGVDTWQEFPQERQRMLRFIRENRVRNVVFLSSDYHCGAVAEIGFPGESFKAWAVVAPPLHAPMRFANSGPNDLVADELIPSTGTIARVKVLGSWEGEGWLHSHVERASQDCASCWKLLLDYHVRDIDSAEVRCHRHEVFMPDSRNCRCRGGRAAAGAQSPSR